MSKTVNSKIQVRRDTSSNWSTNNPTLAAGEIGYDSTQKKIKIGDGSTAWNSLNYFVLQTDLETLNSFGVYIDPLDSENLIMAADLGAAENVSF